MNKLLVLVSILTALLGVSVSGVYAEEQVCTTVYGGGVVCGAVAPEHEVVDTGIIDNPLAISSLLLASSGVLKVFSNKLKKASI